jgi:hypothetical protein
MLLYPTIKEDFDLSWTVGPYLLRACSVDLGTEEFAVVIHQTETPRHYYFITGYVAGEPGWSEKKRTRLIKTYPRKSKNSNKTGATK